MSSHGGDDDQPLPPGWSKEYSNSQKRHFFFHKDTKHTQWHFPTASEAKDPTKAKRRAEMNKEKEKDNKKRPSGGGDALSSSQHAKRARTTSSSSDSKKAAAAAEQEDDDFLELADQTSVAVIVPYRDLHEAQKRSEHLAQFVPHMHKFFGKLKQKGLISYYHIYIVEQSNDGLKFNRGKLLNVGFDMACKHHKKPGENHPPHDVFIFHDVDLLPGDDLGQWYSKFPTKPLHIARVWNRYSNNKKYIGGIVSISKSDYKRINGFPNTFWGWGGEDDEMQKRLEKLGIQFDFPTSGTIRDLEDMTVDQKMSFLKQNKKWKCMVKWEALEEHETTWRTNGLANLTYKIKNITPIDDTNKATRLTVEVGLNPGHWGNEKAGVDYEWEK